MYVCKNETKMQARYPTVRDVPERQNQWLQVETVTRIASRVGAQQNLRQAVTFRKKRRTVGVGETAGRNGNEYNEGEQPNGRTAGRPQNGNER